MESRNQRRGWRCEIPPEPDRLRPRVLLCVGTDAFRRVSGGAHSPPLGGPEAPRDRVRAAARLLPTPFANARPREAGVFRGPSLSKRVSDLTAFRRREKPVKNNSTNHIRQSPDEQISLYKIGHS